MRSVCEKKNQAQNINLTVSRAPLTLCLVFSRLRPELRDKYTLAEQSIGDYTYNHLFVFDHLGKRPEVLKAFKADLEAPLSFEE